ncbi:MAG: glycoside hydrolase family 88 protein [Paludibacter sp.]|nr:glycoside hydrolase family 88 protein [Paludibacter sp.]
MKRNKLVIILISVLFFIPDLFGAIKLPDKKVVLKKMVLTNAYFLNKWQDPGKIITLEKKTWPSNMWTRSVYFEGLMALNSVKPDTTYINYATRWGNFHEWNLRAGVTTRNADNQCCGQTYIDLYQLDTTKKERICNVKASFDSMIVTDKIDDWFWIDAIQMAMPVFAKLGVIYEDPSYWNRMYEMYNYTKTELGGGLYNANDNLWWRDKDFVPPYKEPNGEDCYWARGNGWVLAALVRVLNTIPATEPHYNEYLTDYKNMLEALVPLQRKDGMWNVSLHDPNNFGGKELTGTALFTYAMAWGVNNNLIDSEIYTPVLVKAWNALIKKSVHCNGMLGWVQGTGKEPKDGQPLSYNKKPDFEDYGLGCFLLAGSEVYKLK